MEIRLDGRAAIVTGGSKGLGLATARELAASGADVAIFARGAADLEAARAAIGQSAQGRVMAQVCDVARAEDIAGAFAAVEAAFGHVDIVVNNAGISRALSFEAVTDAIWQEDLDLKLFAAIRLTRLAWPGMVARRWGRVINVLNIGAKAPRPASAPTAVSRAAGMALTKVLAGEGAPHGVLVNALLVGLIESDQWVRRHQAQGANETLESFLQKLADGADIPLGRIGRAEEFANIACFLASDAAGYITGTAINVDGGRSPVV
jgi:3-oxoacyl-[acyl-carrier protein] reductase